MKQKECDYIQGYLFSKPVPADMYEKLLRVGYIKPVKQDVKPAHEKRKFYRFDFPFPVLGQMTITEVNNRRVDVGATEILVKDISLGGVKVQSSLKLPVNADFKFKFKFIVMDEQFNLKGTLRWKDKAKGDTYHYGIASDLCQVDEKRLASIINKMSALRNRNQEIPGTEFVDDDSLLIS
ncbi:PilZ domain-containing protein [Sporosarcina sp. 179-K 8C2 HS]|uniref:PilZ domain-containing protein n=1 Tax=Sporosarcina sp. 179-K 8C2 HS TaxID=3142387 RepID=UPI0039A27EA1